MFDRRLILNFDVALLVAVLLLCFLGIVNLNSIYSSAQETTAPYFYKQIYWVLVSLCVLFAVININYLRIVRYAYYLHAGVLVLLGIVLLCGTTKFGSQRWIFIGGFSLQPSELAKITLILCLSKFFADNISPKPYTIRDFFWPVVLIMMTFLPIYLQPDLGTAGIVFLVSASMIFFLNINRKSFFRFFAVCLAFLPGFWFLLKDYQKKRVLVFINPDLDPLNAGYQVIQSKIAVGSGGLLGKGYKMGTQTQLRFLPEQHTDFVFSVWAEEWGFLGCLFILLVFFFIIYRGLRIAYFSKNFSASFVAVGISCLFLWHIIINVFMTLGLFPVVGVTLPFFSYGGSSLLTNMLGTALLLNIGMRKFK